MGLQATAAAQRQSPETKYSTTGSVASSTTSNASAILVAMPRCSKPLYGRAFEVVLLATLPSWEYLFRGGPALEQRLLLANPILDILMTFPFAGLLKSAVASVQIVLS